MHWRSKGLVFHCFPVACRGAWSSQELVLVERTVSVVGLLTLACSHAIRLVSVLLGLHVIASVFSVTCRAVSDPSLLVRLGRHCIIILSLVFLQLRLVETGLGVQSIFVQVALLVELGVDIGSLQ